MDTLMNVDIDRVVRLGQVARVEKRSLAFDVFGTKGVGEDRIQILDPLFGGLEPLRVVEAGRERPGVDRPPTVAEMVGVDAVEHEPTLAILQRRHAILIALQQKVDRLAAELRGIETVEQDRSTASLRMADFADEYRGVGALVAALFREKRIADPLDQQAFDRLGRSGVLEVPRRVFAGADRAQ